MKKEEKAEKRTHNKRRRRNNKIRRARVLQVKKNQVAPKMEMMINIIKSPRLKRKQARQYMAIARRHEFVSLNYNSMPNLGSRTIYNVPIGKLPHFGGTKFCQVEPHDEILSFRSSLGSLEVVKNGMDKPLDPSNTTSLEYCHIHLNAQATSGLLSAFSGEEYKKSNGFGGYQGNMGHFAHYS